MNYTVVSFFAGAGGMDYGFSEAGYKILCGVNRNTDCCETHRNWSNATVINTNLLEINIEDIPQADIILASLTSVSFSKANPSKQHSKLYEEEKIFQVITHCKPRAFVIESTKAHVSEISKFYEGMDYKLYSKLLNTKEHGIAQNRKIWVTVGIHKDIDRKFEFLNKSEELIFVKKVINNHDVNNIKNRMKFSRKSIDRHKVNMRYKEVDFNDIAPSLKAYRLYRKDLINVAKDCYYSLSWEEAAAIQTFPNWFKFSGSLSSKFEQINTSFPPELGRQIAMQLKEVLSSSFGIQSSSSIFIDNIPVIEKQLIKEEENNVEQDTINPKNIDLVSNCCIYPKENFNRNVCLQPLNDYDKSSINFINQLESLSTGNEDAYSYHNLVFECLNYIFKGSFIRGKIEKKINNGRKKVDIIFDNYDETGFFAHIGKRYNIYCPKIFIECKNYSDDPGNPELDQLLGRLGRNTGWLGMLVCREIKDESKLLARCKDILNQHNKYILFLHDLDIKTLVKLKEASDDEGMREFFSVKWDELIM
ncbi:DNA cytosine methyltransferase [Paenibacillus sp. RC84]|uniref:DNA cytosine methyltransferase n=1 Tax=Paenibacillus sp. RC84 TaxID=3156252 RepID=UPI003516A79A